MKGKFEQLKLRRLQLLQELALVDQQMRQTAAIYTQDVSWKFDCRCGKEFVSESDLQAHLKLEIQGCGHDGIRKIRKTAHVHVCCCGAGFVSYNEMQVHIAEQDSNNHRPMGEENKYWICEKCKSKYVSREALDNHNCKPTLSVVIKKRGRATIGLDLRKLATK